MKLKYNIAINEIGEGYLGVPVSSNIVDFDGLLRLNETGAFIVEQLNNEISLQDLVSAVAKKYSCSFEEANDNVTGILDTLKNAGLIID